MKKIIILLFFLSLSSFAQTCFLSRSFVKSIEVLKQVYSDVGKVFVQKKVFPQWKYYKSKEIKGLIDKHNFSFLNIPDYLNDGRDLKTMLFLCMGFEEMLSRRNVVFMKNYEKYIYCTNKIPVEIGKHAFYRTLTLFPYSPLYFDENTLLLIIDCYPTYSFLTQDGDVIYLPSKDVGYDHGPDKFIFVFKRIKEGDSDKIILAKFQILYDEGLAGKVFCDNEKEVEKFLDKLREKK